MKIFKKIISISLALAMVLGLAACGAQEEPDDGSIKTVDKGKLTVSMSPDFIPMVFVDSSKSGMEQFAGFDVELAKYLAEGLELELVINPMDLSSAQEAVDAKTADLSISGYGWTEGRFQNFLLSDPYYAGDGETAQSIICLAEKEGSLKEADSFAGLKIGVQSGSLQETLAKTQLPESAEIQGFDSIAAAVEALKGGSLDGVCVPHGTGVAMMLKDDALAFTGFDFDVSEQVQGNIILLNKKSDRLLEAVNQLLAAAYEQDLYSQWYEAARELALSDSAKEQSYDAKGKAVN